MGIKRRILFSGTVLASLKPLFHTKMANRFYTLESLTFCAFFLFLLPSVYPISFQITRFDPNDNRIIYGGGATNYNGTVSFNSDIYMYQVGRLTYAQKVPLWDSSTQKLSDFSTHFSFYIDIEDRTNYASGFAFFLAPVEFDIPANSAGGFLGLYNITTNNSSTNQIVHVEFDTFPNLEWDPPFRHVGINNNSIASVRYANWNATVHTGVPADVWIAYNSTAKNLSVSWQYRETSTSQENNSISYIIDLRKALPEWVRIGFTAATSNAIERHILQSWKFSSSLEIKKTRGNKARTLGLSVGLSVSMVTLFAVLAIVFFTVRRRKLKRREITETMNLTSINDDLERRAGPRRFSYNDLVSATNNFSDERKLGEGGFGVVYKGYLNDLDMAVAVKKLSRNSKQGKKEYTTEVKIISQLRHRNLVQLIGWCHDRGELLLVYELMPNGTLYSQLFSKRTPLTWPIRYRIALGLASALLYLHEEWEQCVVHRDVKSSNIMLDSSFTVKLGDFGLARLMDHELGPQTTGLAGTLGYLAPEYVSTGRASKESDVYSFGVVALEIATGRKAVDPIEKNSEMSLVEWVWTLYGAGKLSMAFDARLNMEFDEKQLECLMTTGLWCAYPDRNLRPSVRQAIQVLNFEAALPSLPAKMPVPLYHVPTPDVSSVEPLISCSSLELGR